MSMPRISLNVAAPDFVLKSFNEKMVRLSDYCGKSKVVLVFNRGFM
jgi:peroxiredoxin